MRYWLRLSILGMFLAHLVFGSIRLVRGAYAKRWHEVAEWQARGEIGYQFRHSDDETIRLVTWLCDSVPMDEVVLYSGEERGSIQLLAALLAPRVLVRADAVPADAERAAGGRIFRGRPPWRSVAGKGVTIVVGEIYSCRLTYR
jgi:hypothetical protein